MTLVPSLTFGNKLPSQLRLPHLWFYRRDGWLSRKFEDSILHLVMNELMNNPNPKRKSLVGISLLLASFIGAAAAAVCLATFGHAPASARPYYVLAAIWTATATIAPIWLESLIFNGGTFQLAVVTWRLMTMLGAFMIAGTFPSEVRNYFLSTLMACYFVALPLESLLLARRASK